jgi:DNA polymerase-3 subunit epsilon
MVLNLRNPLAFFDLETTGINISKDRIVELAIIKVMPDGERIKKVLRLNPTIPIPIESSLIHGIYDKDIENEPTFKSIAKTLAKFLEGADLSGFNIIKFDVPMLVEEFLRADVNFSIENRKLIDSQKIFHLMEKRNLTAAYKFYCDKKLENAHSAEMDTLASLEVLESQIEKYQGLAVFDGLDKKIGKIENNMATLHELTASNMIDLAGRMIKKDEAIVFNFGKHRGKTVTSVLEKEPSYYEWIMNGDFPLDTKRRLTEIRLKSFKK